MNKNILLVVLLVLGPSACEDFFDPAIENNRDLESMYNDPEFATGLLYTAYNRLPTNGWNFSELATDDAVSSNLSHDLSRVATGQWAANFNPLSEWTRSKAAIQYLNLMLSQVDKVTYSEDEATNTMFRDRLKGEAYGLRALFTYHLLQAHGGIAGGQLLGIPLILEPEDKNSDFRIPRASFEAGMQQIYADVEKAIEFLPLDYQDIANVAQIPDKYREMGATSDGYNRVFGNGTKLRMTERIALAVRSKAALLAASPAFSQGTNTTWEDAANYAADILDLNGGIGGLAANGVTWFANTAEINGLSSGNNPPEILWRTNLPGNSADLEADNYPPTLFGRGLVNPTQNLVDAFPMANGYPITDPASGYDPANPYQGRDPRLQQFIVVNQSTLGPGGATIVTAVNGATNDALNRVETSTRTGYYLRKLLREDVNLNPTSVNGQRHIKPHIRYTEIYLNYAEAANEAWGPMGTGGNAYSAYDVIKAIRQRAKIGVNNGDAYLESAKGDQAAMRELIRNERRLELSFEGFRFWDLRRWKKDLTETAIGVRIENGNHTKIPVENRIFADYMIYGPIPRSEVLKFGLEQNTGW